jgi:hypothetical protein
MLKEDGGFNMTDVDIRTKQSLLEIDLWNYEIVRTPNGFNVEAVESDPTFFISLSKVEDKVYGIKFDDKEGGYKWETDKVKMFKKAHFLKTVATEVIGPKFKNGEIKTLVFAPEASDGMESKRLSLFDNLYEDLKNSVATGEFVFDKEDKDNRFNGSMSITYVKK